MSASAAPLAASARRTARASKRKLPGVDGDFVKAPGKPPRAARESDRPRKRAAATTSKADVLSVLSQPLESAAVDDFDAIGIGYARGEGRAWAVATQLASRKAAEAIRLRQDPSQPFLAWDGHAIVETEARSLAELTAWLCGQSGAMALYVGQDRKTPSPGPLSVAVRLNGKPRSKAAVTLADGNGHQFSVGSRQLRMALAQNPRFAVACASSPPALSSPRKRFPATTTTAATAEKLAPVSMKDILTSHTSVLGDVNLRDVVSLDAFLNALAPADRAALYPLLPAVESADAKGLVELFRSNVHFAASLNTFRDMLVTGVFDPDYRAKARGKRRRQAGWTDDKEREHEAFYALNLSPKPADDAAVRQWSAFDALVRAEADKMQLARRA